MRLSQWLWPFQCKLQFCCLVKVQSSSLLKACIFASLPLVWFTHEWKWGGVISLRLCGRSPKVVSWQESQGQMPPTTTANVWERCFNQLIRCSTRVINPCEFTWIEMVNCLPSDSCMHWRTQATSGRLRLQCLTLEAHVSVCHWVIYVACKDPLNLWLMTCLCPLCEEHSGPFSKRQWRGSV